MMNAAQKNAYDHDIAEARRLTMAGDLQAAFAHLERAHVIGQNHVVPHVRVHWLMLQIEWRRSRPVAVLGQLVRIVLGALGSAVGVVPAGNTGGTNISMFKRLPVEPGLQAIIDGRSRTDQT
jgi:Protein of unknown function (DUF3703)